MGILVIAIIFGCLFLLIGWVIVASEGDPVDDEEPTLNTRGPETYRWP